MPSALDQVLYDEVNALKNYRLFLDDVIERWIVSLTKADLNSVLQYGSIKGAPAKKRLGEVILHFFSHQALHGQVTTLLFQCGKDIGATDLLVLIPDQAYTA